MQNENHAATAGAYGRALLLGAVSGLRSQTAVAALALATLPDQPYAALAEAPAPWGWLGTRAAQIAFGLAAVGEYVGDKLPQTPGRLDPAPLGGRLAFGALAGAAVCRAEGLSSVVGGALGALGALGGSWGGYQYRTGVARRTGWPDLPLAIAEDAAAIILAFIAIRTATGHGEAADYTI